ncbi:MAG: hypothetical protein UT41_C0001G0479 [Candidatus Wolfebacteria bacterium GW2011_GWC2_39_22]|uniref:Uncharacterized protein n=1 Tax=Candidatus Wolfebacteria bacterium GW2011_GWC2_39_22 TaxID=1619013 RepID=A0A0G0QRC2_9BACT|nr:MAG: hypothetical protein UT41_C0001G0479 [Candidatus Wolfebacteria bacterium GW2011_GWC2_39_22]
MRSDSTSSVNEMVMTGTRFRTKKFDMPSLPSSFTRIAYTFFRRCLAYRTMRRESSCMFVSNIAVSNCIYRLLLIPKFCSNSRSRIWRLCPRYGRDTQSSFLSKLCPAPRNPGWSNGCSFVSIAAQLLSTLLRDKISMQSLSNQDVHSKLFRAQRFHRTFFGRLCCGKNAEDKSNGYCNNCANNRTL